jgi:hypothetical protein
MTAKPSAGGLANYLAGKAMHDDGRVRLDISFKELMMLRFALRSTHAQAGRTCATCNAVLADGPQPLSTYEKQSSQAGADAVRGALASRCFSMSEPYLSGWRLILGFDTREEVDAAQEYVARLPMRDAFASPPSVSVPGVEREAIARALYEIQPLDDRLDENGDPIPWDGLASFCKELHYQQAAAAPAQAGADAVRGALAAAYKLNELIAGTYILSLSDFRYLNDVSTQIKTALASPPPAQADAKLADLIKEYARDLRRNSSGSDEYPWEFAKSIADYLEILISRASAMKVGA